MGQPLALELFPPSLRITGWDPATRHAFLSADERLGFLHRIEGSSDLTNWQAEGGLVGAADFWQTGNYRFPVSGRRFWRMVVERP